MKKEEMRFLLTNIIGFMLVVGIILVGACSMRLQLINLFFLYHLILIVIFFGFVRYRFKSKQEKS